MTKISVGMSVWRRSAVLGLLLSLLISGGWSRAEYEANKDYMTLPAAAPVDVETGEVEVVVLFWYGCGHCFRFEPKVSAWSEQLPSDVVVRRMPLALSSRWELFAKVFYAADALGVLDQVHLPLFRAIHEERQRLFTAEALTAFCAKQAGLEQAVVADAMDSLYVQARLAHDQRLARLYQVNSVPNMVVQGKYLVSASTAGSPDRALEVAEFLVNRERTKPQTSTPMMPE